MNFHIIRAFKAVKVAFTGKVLTFKRLDISMSMTTAPLLVVRKKYYNSVQRNKIKRRIRYAIQTLNIIDTLCITCIAEQMPTYTAIVDDIRAYISSVKPNTHTICLQ